MRKIARMVCLILIFAMVFSTTVYATTTKDPRASSYFASTGASVEKTTSGLKIWVDVMATGTMEKLGARTVVVERSSDGSAWSPVKTYTKENYTEMIGSSSAFHSFNLTYDATSGYYYRALVTFYAKKGTGTGEYPQYTSSVKF